MILVALALLIRLFATQPGWVEQYYSRGIYPWLAFGGRSLLGWIPFSIGDILYGLAMVYLGYALVKGVRNYRNSSSKKMWAKDFLRSLLNAALLIYIVFQSFWGLNYSRQGIASQLELKVLPYTLKDLGIVAEQLQYRLEQTAPQVDTVGRLHFNQNRNLLYAGMAAYAQAEVEHPFLRYQAPSVKPSLFTSLGHLVGFTGYYNPFTFEAQIKTSVPVFLKPFIVTHEMAHQLGYAKESEANFVAFLTGKSATNADVRYSIYFELFLYTLSDIRRSDTTMANSLRQAAPPQVQRDLAAFADYLEKSRNPVEPYMARIYDAYLRWNNQPKGRMSYNEVIAWLVAYGKKYGRGAI
ncbi:hypothetical protein BUE76_16850 [Cnuella takakiae]|nr:hypothetical protein BUE76_16850 [Cnuella takakiae]